MVLIRTINFIIIIDGLVDCQDPDCCLTPDCMGKHLCMTVPRPEDKSNPGPFSSFWDRVKFLVEDSGIQRYAQLPAFDKRYALLHTLLTYMGIYRVGGPGGLGEPPWRSPPPWKGLRPASLPPKKIRGENEP
jgi:hypothetical protein